MRPQRRKGAEPVRRKATTPGSKPEWRRGPAPESAGAADDSGKDDKEERTAKNAGSAALIDAKSLIAACAEFGLALRSPAAARLVHFAALLLQWNAVHNLTAIERPAEVGPLHLLDSLAIVPPLLDRAPSQGLRILDVGSGGGLPGIPLAIAWPGAHLVLLDKVRKKTAFLQHAKMHLQLANVEVVHARVETWQAPPFPLIVSRALTTLSEFIALTEHLLAAGGFWAAMKGALPVEEIAALPATVRVVAAVKLRVPLLAAERHLILLQRRQDAPADAGA